jgi:CelD/BcsL family acetyltransferase involved in cellulose biosynthesis
MPRVTGSTAPRAAAAPLTARELPATARDAASALWREIEARLAAADPPRAPALACTWAWTGTWLEQWGDVVAHRFLVAERAGAPVGIALLTDGPRRRLRPRTLHLGTAGEPAGETIFVEHNRLLVADADRAAFARALIDHVAARRGWDRLCLDGMDADDAGLLLGAAADAGLPDPEVEEERGPTADLRAGEDVLDGLSGRRRQRVRRSLKAFGELTTDWAQDERAATAILDELIELHQARWQGTGKPGAFASPRVVAFHRALVARLLPAGRVALVRVRRGEETVGCLYGHVDGDRLLFYQSGLRQYEDNKLRAGVAAHVCFMRACRERGLAVYDFLAPAVRYKEELATGAAPIVWARIERPTWRALLTRAGRRLRSAR